MKFTDLHPLAAAHVSHGNRGTAGSDFRLTWPRPDDQLIANCHRLICQLSIMLEGIEQAADAKASEHERLMMSLRHAEHRAFARLNRIGVTNAQTVCGVQSKQAVADLLLSTTWYRDEPSPERDALFLSFLRDAQRLHYPADPASAALANNQLADARAVIASGDCSLRLIEDLNAQFKRLDHDDMFDTAEKEQLETTLFDMLRQTRAAIAHLAQEPATSVAALQVKSLVLQRLLEISDSDASQLRVDLSRSYLSDLDAFVHANELRREAAPASGSLWSTFSRKLRWWTTAVITANHSPFARTAHSFRYTGSSEAP